MSNQNASKLSVFIRPKAKNERLLRLRINVDEKDKILSVRAFFSRKKAGKWIRSKERVIFHFLKNAWIVDPWEFEVNDRVSKQYKKRRIVHQKNVVGKVWCGLE